MKVVRRERSCSIGDSIGTEKVTEQTHVTAREKATPGNQLRAESRARSVACFQTFSKTKSWWSRVSHSSFLLPLDLAILVF
jgi:hypothetical protein